MNDLKTASQLAAHLRIPRANLNYLIESRGVQPAKRVGSCRLFDQRAVREIKKELRRMRARRGEATKQHDAG